MAALLVVAIEQAMSPPRALPHEKIHPFHFVSLFLIHDTRVFPAHEPGSLAAWQPVGLEGNLLQIRLAGPYFAVFLSASSR